MRRRPRLILAVALIACAQLCAGADVKTPEFDVSGYGLLGNIKLKRLVKLVTAEKTNQLFHATFLEDSAVVLLSEVQREGYLHAQITAHVTMVDGQEQTYRWKDVLGEPLPGDLLATRVRFHVDEGIRYHYRDIHFDGLDSMAEDAARSYFVETRGLFTPKGNRIYTPDKASSSARALQEALERDGYQDAVVALTNVLVDEAEGDVDVTVRVDEGHRYIVRHVKVEELREDVPHDIGTLPIATNQPLSRLWMQDFQQRLVRRQFRKGYPDARSELSVLSVETNDVVNVALRAQVHPGPIIDVGEVRIHGEKETDESVLHARVPLKAGMPLDRTAAEEGRFRLARLGIFNKVEMRYDVVNESTRDVIYEVEEGKQYEITLLAGFGSYELLRGGVILEKHNIWGRAHDSRLKLVQSFKSSSGEFTYTVPQVRWGSDLFFTASGLRRDEVDFTREELASSVGARRRFASIYTDASLRYSYQYLNAAQADFVSGFGVPDARVAATILDLRHDRRDNPITPRNGYKLFSNTEVASEALGGEVDYKRVEFHSSYHRPAGKDRWIHLGLSHGAVIAAGTSTEDLPFNKRFFPGGENSIRGYQEGEASPRNAEGKIIGSESYLGLNLEVEQALTPKWSVVGFLDSMGVAQAISQYPFDELLFAAGGGLRWNTIIGPVRVEYGYNLHRRRHDPAGTLHVSIGFPF